MKITYKGNSGIEIVYEESDTNTEKRIAEQGVAFIRNLLARIREVNNELVK